MMATTSTDSLSDAEVQAIETCPPSQLALDNLVETLAALMSEAITLTGCESDFGSASISVHRVPVAVWHAFSQTADYATLGPRTCIWKTIAGHGSVRISAFCAHGRDCPDLPQVDELELDGLHERAMADQP